MAAATKGFQTPPSLFLSFVPSFRDTKHEFRRTEGEGENGGNEWRIEEGGETFSNEGSSGIP